LLLEHRPTRLTNEVVNFCVRRIQNQNWCLRSVELRSAVSFKTSIWVGRFAPDLEGLPNPQESVGEDAFAAIFARFADRDDNGERIPPRGVDGWTRNGRKRVLGYIAGEYVIYHQAGFAEVVFGGIEPRIHKFLAACNRELGCLLLDANGWEWVTDYYLDLADRG
jgi:hypothetical protein